MYSVEYSTVRLTAADEELSGALNKTVVGCGEEMDRQPRQLDFVLKPELKLYSVDCPQQHVFKEEEVPADQPLCEQEMNSSMDQKDPEPPQVKEEQEELGISQEGEQLVLKQETDTFMVTPTCEDLTLDMKPNESAAQEESVVNMPVIISVVGAANSDLLLLSNSTHVSVSHDKRGETCEKDVKFQPHCRKNRRKKPHVYTTFGKCFTTNGNLRPHGDNNDLSLFRFKEVFRKHGTVSRNVCVHPKPLRTTAYALNLCAVHKHKKKMMAANMNARARTETLVWTDDEVELLLRVTLDYKLTKLQENVDWESCKSKYCDIMDAFQAQYPRHQTDKGFPHGVDAISKAQVTAKLKSIRGKYRQAVETGRRSGQGRVVLLFFELCEEIWGRPPAMRSIDAGIETGDLEESSLESSRQTPTVELSADSPLSSIESLHPAAVKQCGDMLQAKLNSHRGDRLKRKLPADPAVQEDIQIKKRMLELMEESTRCNADNVQQMNTNIAKITSTIQEGFALMRTLILQPHIAPLHSSSGGYGQVQGHPPAFINTSPHPTTPAFTQSNQTR